MTSTNVMESQSATILGYLKTLGDEETFTSNSVFAACYKDSVNFGAVTGFLASLKKKGAITIVDMGRTVVGNRSYDVYRIVDLSNITTKNAGSVGGTIGRPVDGKSKKDKLVNLLLSVAGELDEMVVKANIRDFTTIELLKELGKRAEAAKVTVEINKATELEPEKN